MVAVSIVGQGEPAARLNVVVDWCPLLVTSRLGLSRVIIISPQQSLRRTSLAVVLDALRGIFPCLKPKPRSALADDLIGFLSLLLF